MKSCFPPIRFWNIKIKFIILNKRNNQVLPCNNLYLSGNATTLVGVYTGNDDVRDRLDILVILISLASFSALIAF